MTIDIAYIENCKSPELVCVLRRLKNYERYCNLLKGDIATYVHAHDEIGDMPFQLKECMKLFNGGLLFTVSMFSTRSSEKGKFNRLLTFDEVNSADFKKENAIPEEAMCFAMTNYGNYYCYVAGEGGECVYELDVERCALTVKWDSFSEWLGEQIDFAESLISEGTLEPVADQEN